MKRLLRKNFIGTSFLLFCLGSLMLWGAITVLFMRSFFWQDVLTVATPAGHLVRVHIKENGVVITSVTGWPRRESLSWRSARIGSGGYGIPVMFDGTTYWTLHPLPGIYYSRGKGTVSDPALPIASTTRVTGKFVVIEWAWLFMLSFVLTAPLTAIVIRRWSVRRYRRAKGLCLCCGYDLRATPERCPECGAIPAEDTARE